MKRNCFIVFVVLVGIAVSAGAADYLRWVPAAASNPGLHGSNWSTDLTIFNRSRDETSTIYASFYPDAVGAPDPTEVSIEIEPRGVVMIRDVVAELFGEQRPGAIRLRSPNPFEASSRTFNDGGGDGTYGQGIPAVDYEEFEDTWALLGAANSPGVDGVRTNIGLMNPEPWDSEVRLSMQIPATGEGFAATVELGGYGWLQQDAFALFGLEDREVDNAIINAWWPANNSFGYLSLVDNRTGDGSFILPVDGVSEVTTPCNYDVTFNLNYSDGVEAYVVSLNANPGPRDLEPDPESGWSADFDLTSPAELCYTVLAEDTTGGGWVEVELLYTPVGGETGRRVFRDGPGSAGIKELDGCFHLDGEECFAPE